jgi:hypothetical protein
MQWELKASYTSSLRPHTLEAHLSSFALTPSIPHVLLPSKFISHFVYFFFQGLSMSAF